MVAWMSGLVTGLQNQVQRFESACDLNISSVFYSTGDFLFLKYRSGTNIKTSNYGSINEKSTTHAADYS